MCGVIALLAPFATVQRRKSLLTNLLQESIVRGSDATGIAFVDEENKLVVVKDGEDASTFTKSTAYHKACSKLPGLVIGHTRASSRNWGKTANAPGTPALNQNNHPFFNANTGIAIVHNGLVEDDPWRRTVGEHNGILNEFDGGTDSELFLRMIETIKNRYELSHSLSMLQIIDNTAFNIAGQYVVLVISAEYPNKLWAIRHSRDDRSLALAYIPEEQIIAIASTTDILKESLVDREYAFDFFFRDVLPQGTIINTLHNDNAIEIEILPEEPWFEINTLSITAADDKYSYHTKYLEEKASAESPKNDDDVEVINDNDEVITVTD